MEEGRTKKSLHNMLAGFMLMLLKLVAGLVITRLIIGRYGSACNGLLASITKFLSIISVLAIGISPAARVLLYGPLSERNTGAIASVVCTMERTYRRVGFVSLAFALVLAVVYPLWLCHDFDYWYTNSLILIATLSSFANYLLGAPYKILLAADQRHSVILYNQMAVGLLASGAMLSLIVSGRGFRVVTLAGSVVGILGSLSLCLVARRHYGLTPEVLRVGKQTAPKSIPERRHAIAQGLSEYINSNVDIILITLVMSMADVAVYAVYAAIIKRCEDVISNVISSFGAAFGNMYAKGEMDLMRENIKIYELVVFSLSSTILATALAMLVPFVEVYTSGITDADYHQPVFAALLTLASLFMVFSYPYITVLKAAGRLKQTKIIAYVELSLNLAISVVGVLLWGLPGVALGTLVSAIASTFGLAWYFGRYLIVRSYTAFLGHTAIALVICTIAYCLAAVLPFDIDSYGSWILAAGIVFATTVLLTLILNACFYLDESRILWRKLSGVFCTGR